MIETFFRFFELPEELRYMIIKNMTVLSRINFIIALNGSLNIKASKEDWDNANSDISSEYERESDCDDIDSNIDSNMSDSEYDSD